MKKVKRGVLKTLGIILSIFSIAMIITGFASMKDGNYVPAIVVCSLLLILGIFLIIKGRKTKADIEDETKKMIEKQEAKRQEEIESFTSITRDFTHTAGLSAAPDALCSLTLNKENLLIHGSGFDYNLALSRISSMDLKTDKDIQTFVNQSSSAGKALAGAMMFGVVGALVGGRTKTTTTQHVTYQFFLVVTYRKEEDIDYMIFKSNGQKPVLDFTHAYSLVRNAQENKTIEL